ncbi:hypothetical protein IF1G_10017 [Cordyceps javanica]|uniref:Uncharacterized protein n=1 Tax=Cordyceps javanica TaxID=43265 RepID=A0A545UNU0_9HYPO|nr:hypothetical protein IF1G_10017 [Cordyceps javanica]
MAVRDQGVSVRFVWPTLISYALILSTGDSGLRILRGRIHRAGHGGPRRATAQSTSLSPVSTASTAASTLSHQFYEEY